MVYIRPNANYPLNWNKIRYNIFHRDGYMCQMCGRYSKGNLHCHHIIPVRKGGSHNNNNLVSVCKTCHEDIHGIIK